jgi:N-acetyl-anhydromuramoyl-L-alanine amidase
MLHSVLAIDSEGLAHGSVLNASAVLVPVRFVPSPNCDERPAGTSVDLLVIHAISLPPGEFGGPAIEALFTNTLDAAGHPYFAGIADLKVSTHFLVRRDGRVIQFVPCAKRAWHAGASRWMGRERCNDFSIGIELEGTDDVPFEPAQYTTLAGLTDALAAAYPLGQIAGHSDVAPGRKTDPGPCFDWPRYQASIRSTLAFPGTAKRSFP